MAILTARQPQVQAPDTAALTRNAFEMIQSELAARTQIGQFLASQQQNELKLQAQGRQEIREQFNDQYTRQRQARMDSLNERLQLAQESRADQRLKMDMQMQPLEYQQKQLELKSGNFNLSQTQELAPYKIAGAEADMALNTLRNQEAATKLPVIEGQADLAIQDQNLAKVARGSLGNVKTADDFTGWAKGHMANLPGDPDEQAAEATARLNQLNLAPPDRVRAEQSITSQIEKNKELNSRSGSALFPSNSSELAREFAFTGSEYILGKNGKPIYRSSLTLPEINAGLAEANQPALTQDQYLALPKPDASSSVVNAESRIENTRMGILKSQAERLMVMAKEALQNDDKAGAASFQKQAEEKYAQAQEISARPAAPAPPILAPAPIDPTAPPAAPAAPVNKYRAAFQKAFPGK